MPQSSSCFLDSDLTWYLGDPDFHPAGVNRDLFLFLSDHGLVAQLLLFTNPPSAEEISFVGAKVSFGQYPVKPKRSFPDSPCESQLVLLYADVGRRGRQVTT